MCSIHGQYLAEQLLVIFRSIEHFSVTSDRDGHFYTHPRFCLCMHVVVIESTSMLDCFLLTWKADI